MIHASGVEAQPEAVQVGVVLPVDGAVGRGSRRLAKVDPALCRHVRMGVAPPSPLSALVRVRPIGPVLCVGPAPDAVCVPHASRATLPPG